MRSRAAPPASPRRRALPGCAGALVALGVAVAAEGAPLDEPHVGGVGFSGPTTGDLAAMYWNPAALALLRGHRFTLGATMRVSSTTIERAATDPATGAPGGGRSWPAARGNVVDSPFALPLGPGGFMGIAWDVAGRFNLGLSAFMPHRQRTRFTEDGGVQPTRYHAVDIDLRHLAVTAPALAFRVAGGLRLGVAPIFVLSNGRMVFDEDTALHAGSAGLAADCGGAPCGAENPAAAARYQVASDLDPLAFSAPPAFLVSAGVHYRFRDLDIGIGYTSRPVGGGVELAAGRTTVTPPPGTPALCAADALACTTATLRYALPDRFTLGVTYRLDPRWEISGIARWLTFSLHDDIALRVIGPASGGLADRGLPDSIVFHRGFRDVFDLRARAVRRLGARVRVAGTLRFETSAVPSTAVSPAAVDGTKLEPALAAEVTLADRLILTLGYAAAWMLPVDTGTSAFDPVAAAACADTGGDLANPACAKRLRGQARPSAAGRYRQLTHAASLAATLVF